MTDTTMLIAAAQSDAAVLEARCADLQARCERLEDALERSVEVMEFAYMNAPKQPKEIAIARAALQHTTEKTAPAGEG